MASSPITSWQRVGETMGTATDFIFGGLPNNFRYADDSTLMAEGEEELKSLLMKVKEENEKAGLKLNI